MTIHVFSLGFCRPNLTDFLGPEGSEILQGERFYISVPRPPHGERTEEEHVISKQKKEGVQQREDESTRRQTETHNHTQTLDTPHLQRLNPSATPSSPNRNSLQQLALLSEGEPTRRQTETHNHTQTLDTPQLQHLRPSTPTPSSPTRNSLQLLAQLLEDETEKGGGVEEKSFRGERVFLEGTRW